MAAAATFAPPPASSTSTCRYPRAWAARKDATNPEELFAAGYASCFQQALLVIAQKAGDRLDPATTVQCSVTLFQEGEAYGLSAVLDVDLKSFDEEKPSTWCATPTRFAPTQ